MFVQVEDYFARLFYLGQKSPQGVMKPAQRDKNRTAVAGSGAVTR